MVANENPELVYASCDWTEFVREYRIVPNIEGEDKVVFEGFLRMLTWMRTEIAEMNVMAVNLRAGRAAKKAARESSELE